MDPRIRLRMKKYDDLFTSSRKYISRSDMFRILDYINSLEDKSDYHVYGTLTIDYIEPSLAGCKIESYLTIEEFDELSSLIELLMESQDDESEIS